MEKIKYFLWGDEKFTMEFSASSSKVMKALTAKCLITENTRKHSFKIPSGQILIRNYQDHFELHYNNPKQYFLPDAAGNMYFNGQIQNQNDSSYISGYFTITSVIKIGLSAFFAFLCFFLLTLIRQMYDAGGFDNLVSFSKVIMVIILWAIGVVGFFTIAGWFRKIREKKAKNAIIEVLDNIQNNF